MSQLLQPPLLNRLSDVASVHGRFLSPAPPTCSVSLHGVPDVAVEVVVTSQQQAAGARESHGSDAADDVVVTVDAELLVRAQVEQPAGGVVRACGEGAPVGEELRRSRSVNTDCERAGTSPQHDKTTSFSSLALKLISLYSVSKRQQLEFVS